MVYREAKRNGVELNKGLYLLGNLLPDFNPYHKYVKHYKDYSLDYVHRLVNGIDISNLNEASFKLGILGHYLTDYFCYPHNNNMTFKNDFKEEDMQRAMPLIAVLVVITLVSALLTNM